MILVFYTEKGQIWRVRDDSPNARKYAEQNPMFIEASERPPERAYVDVEAKEIVIPEVQPTEAHNFDFDTKDWVFDLEKAKSLKWEEIKQARDKAEFGGFSWAGWAIDSDLTSQHRIATISRLAEVDPYLEIQWTLADNSSVTLTADRIKDMAHALAQHVTGIHSRARILRSQLLSATEPADLEAITWQSNIT